MFNIDDTALRGGTICLSKAGLAIGGSDKNDVDIAAPNGAGVDFAINGVLYHKADAADIAVSVTDEDGTTVTQQADDTTCLYIAQLDVDGALTFVKGTEVLTADLTAGAAVLHWPRPTADNCVIGAIKIALDGGAHTFGVSDFDDADVTDTYYDLMTLPIAPLTS